jgi:hypothetical protein
MFRTWIFFKLMSAACSNRLVNGEPKPADDVVRRIASGISETTIPRYCTIKI